MSTGALVALVATSSANAQSTELPEWRVDPTPLLALEDDGRPGTEFLRIVGAWRFENGAVVVANAGSSELRMFNRAGQLIASFGRQGGGPGEFGLMRYAWRTADTLFAFDPILKRVTTVHVGSGFRLLATLPIGARGGQDYMIVGRVSDGRFVAKASGDLGWDAGPGVHRVEDAVGFVKSDGTGNVDWVLRAPGLSILLYNPTRDIKQGRMGPTAFSPELVVHAIGNAVWTGDTESNTLARYEAIGRRRDAFTLPLAAEAPSASVIAVRRQAEPGRAEEREFLAAKYSAANLPKRLPVFEAMVSGMNGELWVQKYSGVATAPAMYVVLDGDGKSIGRVATPAGFRVTEVGADYVIGIQRDEDGVETVRLHRLARR